MSVNPPRRRSGRPQKTSIAGIARAPGRLHKGNSQLLSSPSCLWHFHRLRLGKLRETVELGEGRHQLCQARKGHLTPPAPQSEDGTYTGFIKVHLKLRRPVTVPAGIRPQSIYDAIKEVNLAATTDKRTSFYLPLDAIKQLHISSTTTVSEVIQGLRLLAGPDNDVLSFVLKENETGEVEWDAFSIPELQNFLTIQATAG